MAIARALVQAPADPTKNGRKRTPSLTDPLSSSGTGRARRQAISASGGGTSALIRAQEDERRRIARDLHDVVGQALTAVKLSLEAAERRPDVTSSRTYIRESVAIVEQAIQEVRTLALDLRPSILDDLGIVPAIRWYLNREAQRSGCRVSFVADIGMTWLDPELETTCFRIAQEALTNIARHAKARHIRLELGLEGDRLVMIVADDGVGFDVGQARRAARHGRSLGLEGIAERVDQAGGDIDIQSTPGQGTRLRVTLPIVSGRVAGATVDR